jgi:hypothetical protein
MLACPFGNTNGSFVMSIGITLIRIVQPPGPEAVADSIRARDSSTPFGHPGLISLEMTLFCHFEPLDGVRNLFEHYV